MKTTKHVLRLLPLLCFAHFCGAVTITDLGTLGGEYSTGEALNDLGQVVGLSADASNLNHTFLYSQGQMSNLQGLNSDNFADMDINNHGVIASGSRATDGVYYPVQYDSNTGTTTVLGALGQPASDGVSGCSTALNVFEHTVGFSYVNGMNTHAFSYDTGGVMQDVHTGKGSSVSLATNDNRQDAGWNSVHGAFVYANGFTIWLHPESGPYSYARGINNQGYVVGEYLVGNSFHGFIYTNGIFTDILFPGSTETTAYAINNDGVVVGVALVRRANGIPSDPLEPHAFMYRDGDITDLNSLILPGSGWQRLSWAYSINDNGEIVGNGVKNGQTHAFLLTP